MKISKFLAGHLWHIYRCTDLKLSVTELIIVHESCILSRALHASSEYYGHCAHQRPSIRPRVLLFFPTGSVSHSHSSSQAMIHLQSSMHFHKLLLFRSAPALTDTGSICSGLRYPTGTALPLAPLYSAPRSVLHPWCPFFHDHPQPLLILHRRLCSILGTLHLLSLVSVSSTELPIF